MVVQSGPHGDGCLSDPRKLPLWQSIYITYSSYFRHFRDVVRVTWLWIVLVAAMWTVAEWVRWSWAISISEQYKKGTIGDTGASPVVAGSLYVFAALLFALALVDIAVAWHRRLILAERPRFIGSHFATAIAWQYFAVFLVLTGAAAIPPALLYAVSMLDLESLPETLADIVAAGFIFSAVFATFAIVVRFSLVLPARATGDHDSSFMKSWKATRGNTWRLLWATLACVVLPALLLELPLAWFGLPSDRPSPTEMFTTDVPLQRIVKSSLGMPLQLVYQLLTLPICIGYLSYCYQYFARRE